MVLTGKQAPDFQTAAVVDHKIVDNYCLPKDTYVILFFYPLDFTFVCPTELHAFQEKLTEFSKRGAQVIGCSVDSVFTHLAWLDTPKQKGGIQGVSYPLLSDLTKEIAASYGVLAKSGVAYRGLFLIDQKGVVRHQVVNDLPLGRSVEEALRMLDALQFHEQHGEVCPANWQKGKSAMLPTQEGLVAYLGK